MAEKIKKDIYSERDRNYIIYTIGNSCKKTDNSGWIICFWLYMGLFIGINNIYDLFKWVVVFDKVYGMNNMRIFGRMGIWGGKYFNERFIRVDIIFRGCGEVEI